MGDTRGGMGAGELAQIEIGEWVPVEGRGLGAFGPAPYAGSV